MAKPATTRGSALYVKIESAPASGTFAHPCAINAKRGIKFSTQTNKELIPDCTNPDDPIWQECIKYGLACSIDGAGKNDSASVPTFMTWLASKDTKNIQVWLGTFGYWSGAFHLTAYDVSSDVNEKASNTISLENDGPVVWTSA